MDDFRSARTRGAGRGLALAAAFACGMLTATAASAISIGLVDDFEDGTTANWTVALGPIGAVHPAPPQNVGSGGPLGAGDAFLQLTSIGGSGPGSRLVGINAAQWAGDYLTAGVTAIAMDLRNFGDTDLELRLLLENPMGAPPTAAAYSASILLPTGGAWTRAVFALDALSLTSVLGDVNALLANVTALRLVHAPDVLDPVPAIVGRVGVDRITALGDTVPPPSEVPEPGTFGLLAFALLALGRMRRHRQG